MGFGKDKTGVIIKDDLSQALGTLAPNVAISVAGGITLGEDFRRLKTDAFVQIEGLDPGEGNGLIVGMANGELSVTEIAEAINLGGPSDRNDRGAVEQVERAVFPMGIYEPNDPAATDGLFKGKTGPWLEEIKKRWTFSDPEGWQWFIFNAGAAALTTGSTVRVNATHYGVWVQ